MMDELLGLPLETALARLKAQGIVPCIQETCAPRRAVRPEGMLRVVRVGEGGRRLTAARFLDPISRQRQENGV